MSIMVRYEMYYLRDDQRLAPAGVNAPKTFGINTIVFITLRDNLVYRPRSCMFNGK